MNWINYRFRALYSGWQQTFFALIMLVPFALTLIALAGVATVVLIPLFQAVVLSGRQLTNTYREGLAKQTGTAVPVPYAKAPIADDREHPWSPRSLERIRWILVDPATWQDLVWMLINPVVCVLTNLLPAALVLYAPTVISFSWLIHPEIGPMFGSWRLLDPTAFLGHYAWLGLPAGFLIAAWMLATAPNNLKALFRFSAALLAPARNVPVDDQVAELTSAQEAELRRIERDLHDGAQARMVAVGMTLRTVERLLDTDPGAVRALVVEARETSAAALRDLRELVRGIHPPILAERGLTDALRAVALQVPLAVDLNIDLAEPLEPPIEAALYFAVCELLTNAAKHAEAERASLTLRTTDDRIIVIVGDDGQGGADPDRGSGLRGIRRRLASFNGTLAISSPAGGPTTATMEIPVAHRDS
ncbi:MAG TPA: sensor histidine kinase [Pseudonocardiaceae bacterium]|nr:sensor histidine kinase [Pseudonocardiaceae bacterium]